MYNIYQQSCTNHTKVNFLQINYFCNYKILNLTITHKIRYVANMNNMNNMA